MHEHEGSYPVEVRAQLQPLARPAHIVAHTLPHCSPGGRNRVLTAGTSSSYASSKPAKRTRTVAAPAARRLPPLGE